MSTDDLAQAAEQVMQWCADAANHHHGYEPIATSVNHDLANAYEQIASEVEKFRGYGDAICRRCDVQAAFCPCEKPDVTPVDREALEDLIYGVIDEHVCAVPMEGHSTAWTVDGIYEAADALISRGVVTGQRDGVAAVDLAGILTLAADLGTESWQEMADHLLSRFEIHERTPGQRDGGEPHGTR